LTFIARRALCDCGTVIHIVARFGTIIIMSCWRIRVGALETNYARNRFYYLLEKIVDMRIWSKNKMKQSKGTTRPLS
jgi:hypothetical protein